MNDIISQVNKNKNLLLTVDSPPKVGTLVFAPDSQHSYCRAVIQSFTQSNNVKLAQVLFIDTGKTASIKLSELRQLRPFTEDEKKFKELFNQPALAFECVLANIRPTFMSNVSGHWSAEAEKEFKRIIHPGERRQKKTFYGEIFSVVNSVVSLTLICSMGESEDSEKINVNDYLIKNRYAEHKEENYLSRSNHELRLNQGDMSDKQRKFYEETQYDQYYLSDFYPEPPEQKDCYKTIILKGPFSPLEIELMHLTTTGASKKVFTF